MTQLLSSLPPTADVCFLVLATLTAFYLVSGLDDLFIDLVAWCCGLRPTEISGKDLECLANAEQKRIAIIVPAWKEASIIARMLEGNRERIDYRNYYFFVGVYPNDDATVQEVLKAGKLHPNIQAVINSRPGPTSKGQMLNQVISAIFEHERENGIRFDACLMQDAEDIIHPKMLQLVNDRLDQADFIQTPVFSLEVKRGQLVASTYMDEFAEHHTKDLLVRERLGGGIPSAGVGTTLSRRLIETLRTEKGDVFNEGSLTEDYELGLTSHLLGMKASFACCFYRKPDGRREFIATREFFPKRFSRSVRQKTRWSIGISLQGWRNLGWQGGLSARYFLYRDRKGIFTNPVVAFSYPSAATFAVFPELIARHSSHHELIVLGAVNLGLMSNRILQRIICVARVYGLSAALPVPVIWPLGSVINALASLNAVKTDIKSRIQNVAIAWAKTEHELPDFFGQTVSQGDA